MIYRVEDGDFKDMATQHMLAPIFSGLKAEKALSKGDLFIINDTLYKATAAIALNATITIGTNAELASTMAEELSSGVQDVSSQITNIHASVTIYGAYRSGNIIQISGSVAANLPGSTRLFIVAAAIKPKVAAYIQPMRNGTDTDGRLLSLSNANGECYFYGTTIANNWMFSFTYIID